MRVAVSLALLCLNGPASAEPAGTLRALGEQLRACLAQPAAAGAGTALTGEITLRFSLRRDGAPIGRPHITFSRLPAGEADKQMALDAFAAQLNRCLPLRITESLGGAIAGRPLTLRLSFGARERGI
ncbi:hypothetical protein M2323_003004 [Rhodoblastus acidophilus]|uniref:hypothetical protein n=1 Tax=Rhodoblastus acidophilus TaxID=1074 RepID=UPI0022249B24|nr:hypothetical protein [Rhodoblastus acidophilus]MCW2285076.1 hypothetical protein [Rhodoblastus acidophilus]MCW2334066.1 hypothetical protein [Rhodoblastus acidophilus]